MNFESFENRIQLTNFSPNTVGYATRCMGYRLSRAYPDTSLNILGTIVDDKFGAVQIVYKDENYFRYLALVVTSYNHVDKYLFVDKVIYEKYGALQQCDDCDICVFDIESKKMYLFDSKLKEGDGYKFDGVNCILNLEYARHSSDIDAGELLVLSMGRDSKYDADGRRRRA